MIESLGELPSAFLEYEKEETRVPVGTAGKNAIAKLVFKKFGDKTHLTDLYCEIPAKVLRPIYYDEYLPGVPYILFINPTGGVVQGDRYLYDIRLDEGAEAFITDTSATKIYKMDLNYASKYVDVYLSKNSRLEFIPREIIAFAMSRWFQRYVFHVTEGCKFLYSDIFSPGRIARGEFWEFDIFASKVFIERDGKLELADNFVFKREDRDDLDVLFGSNKFLLTSYWYSENAAASKKLIDFENTYGGATDMASKKGVIIKALSDDMNDLRKLQTEIWRTFRKVEVGTGIPNLRMYY